MANIGALMGITGTAEGDPIASPPAWSPWSLIIGIGIVAGIFGLTYAVKAK